MAALDFPSSPTNGQVFGNWVYNLSKQAWQSKPLTPAKTVNSPTAPVSPADGDQWFNTNNGSLYIYYTDANGSQWVESRAPITADGYISPNYVINGAFDIWQRGTSFIGTSYNYSADRWIIVRGGFTAGYTATRQASGLQGIQYCIRAQRDSGNTALNDIGFSTAFESANSISLAGKTVTLSFYARKGANYSATNSQISTFIHSGTGTDQAASNMSWNWTGGTNSGSTHSLTSSWVRYSQTITLPSNITQAGIGFLGIPTGTAGANDYFEVTGVQLEEGPIATPFRRNSNSIQGELAACQRYYYREVAGTGGAIFFNGTSEGSGLFFTRATPVTMRAVPTLAFSGVNLWSNATGGVSNWTYGSPRNGPNTLSFNATTTSYNAGYSVYLYGTTAGTSYYEAVAEL